MMAGLEPQPLKQLRAAAPRDSKARVKGLRSALWCRCMCFIVESFSLAYSGFGRDCGIDSQAWRVPFLMWEYL